MTIKIMIYINTVHIFYFRHYIFAGTGSLSEFGFVNIADAQVCISDTVKSLGVILDTNLTFRPHVDAVCKSCFFHIRALCNM